MLALCPDRTLAGEYDPFSRGLHGDCDKNVIASHSCGCMQLVPRAAVHATSSYERLGKQYVLRLLIFNAPDPPN